MKRELLAIALFTSLALPALAETKAFDFEGFSKIDASAGVTVNVVNGTDYAVTGDAKSGNIKRLIVKKKGDQLVVSRKSEWWRVGGLRQDRFVVSVTMPDIDGVEASSGSTVRLSSFSSDKLSAATSSGATLVLQDFETTRVLADVSSGSTVRITGQCDAIIVKASSGATVDAQGFECATATVDASSGSTLRVFATDGVTGQVSSGATIVSYGNAPEHTIDKSSGGSVIKR